MSPGHRYWRLVAPGESKWAVVEVKWYGADGLEIKGGSSISSGEAAEWSRSDNAFDGDLQSYWLADKAESSSRWIGAAFKDPVEVVSVQVMQYAHENYRTYTAELHFSDDAKTWTYADVGDLQGDGVEQADWETIPSTHSSDNLDFF